jgi:hypothetical protein
VSGGKVGSWWSGRRRDASERLGPKIAHVFDEDVNIYNAECVKWAIAWRYNPEKGAMILPGQNMLLLDPSLGTDHLLVNIFKAGFDCAIALVGHVDRLAYEAATVSEPFAPPAKTRPRSEDELTQEMQNVLREKPRTWKEILEHFAGQTYPIVYRAFDRLHPELGRMADECPFYRRDAMMWFWDQCTSDPRERAEITASPLRATSEQLRVLPPALVITAEADVLRDEGEAYANKLREAGVRVTEARFQGIIHDFVMLNALANTAAARGAIALAAAWLREGF